MICINLLPWRESKLYAKKKVFLCQLLAMVMLPCMSVMAFRSIEQADINSKTQRLHEFKTVNQQVLNKVESLDNVAQSGPGDSDKRLHLIRIINQKNRLPEILAKLTSDRKKGRFIKLTMDLRTVEIEFLTTDVNETLSLFQLLNADSLFCHVSFEPGHSKSKPNHKSHYKFNATLCDGPVH